MVTKVSWRKNFLAYISEAGVSGRWNILCITKVGFSSQKTEDGFPSPIKHKKRNSCITQLGICNMKFKVYFPILTSIGHA